MSIKNVISVWLLGVVICSGCAGTSTQLYVNPGFDPQAVSLITVIPVVDQREHAKIGSRVISKSPKWIKKNIQRRKYVSITSDILGSALVLPESGLDSAEAEWIRGLGPDGSNYVFLVSVQKLKHVGISSGRAEIFGYLFDKESGELMWKGFGSRREWNQVIPSGFWAHRTAYAMAIGELTKALPKKTQ